MKISGSQREGRAAIRVRAQGVAAHAGSRREAEGLSLQQEQRARLLHGALRGGREPEGQAGGRGEGTCLISQLGNIFSWKQKAVTL